VLYLGTLVFGLMVLLTLGIVVIQLIRGASIREPSRRSGCPGAGCR
jgi:hypothetical protein